MDCPRVHEVQSFPTERASLTVSINKQSSRFCDEVTGTWTKDAATNDMFLRIAVQHVRMNKVVGFKEAVHAIFRVLRGSARSHRIDMRFPGCSTVRGHPLTH